MTKKLIQHTNLGKKIKVAQFEIKKVNNCVEYKWKKL